MKIFNLLFILLLSSLFFSCSKDEDSPMETPTECTVEISFIEDGSMVTLPIAGLNNDSKAVFDLKDPSPFNAQGVSRALAIRMQTGSSGFDIVLELNVADSNSCIPIGVYDVSTLDSSEGLLSFTYFKGFESYFVGLGEGSGVLEITKCDFDNKLISGKFSCTLVKPFGTDQIVVTDGIFVDVCLE